MMEVLIEGKLPEENIFCGRTRRDAPEIDGLVFVSSEGGAVFRRFCSGEDSRSRRL